ncbi:MAG TPA: peptidoglycan-binding domain-containing protein [Gemmatimonadaceae bacterium]|nr:peptidoglycan-binding domain-containing protein [Gemmatimonadaceae bacterium]
MHSSSSIGRGRAWLAAALVLAVATDAAAQSRVVLPAGSVLLVRTNTALESATARAGQTFETTVESNVGVDEYTVIPAGSRIRGTITTARAATREQSGVIEVAFDRLILADGSTFQLRGKLTSTDSAERRQIKANPNARVVLVGGRGGLGAAIAGASGNNTNTLLAALGGLLSEGRDVSVPAGSPLAVELERALTLRGRGRARNVDETTIFTAPERIRSAQEALARLNYYRGPITGTMDDATRRALFAFQIDRRLTGTGNLDGRTAQELGLNLGAGLAGAILTGEEASSIRRDAQSLVAQYRGEIGINAGGRLRPGRAYSQSELEIWFAMSAFADNSAIYEQVVRNGGNNDALVLAGRALMNSARRLDTALQGSQTSTAVQNGWTSVRRRLTALE